MFELLDDDAPSPQRMPSPRLRNRTSDPSARLNGYLLLVALGGLVLGESLQALRAAQIAAWSVAAVAGWWFVFRCVCQIQASWQSEPTRRKRLLIGSVVSVLSLLLVVYAAAIKSEAVLAVGIAVGWGLSLLAAGMQFLRREDEPTRRTVLLIESALFTLALVILVYAMTIKSEALTRSVWGLYFTAQLLQLFLEGPQESP